MQPMQSMSRVPFKREVVFEKTNRLINTTSIKRCCNHELRYMRVPESLSRSRYLWKPFGKRTDYFYRRDFDLAIKEYSLASNSPNSALQ